MGLLTRKFVNKWTYSFTYFRGIYSDQLSELGKGNKIGPYKKKGKRSSRGTTIRRG